MKKFLLTAVLLLAVVTSLTAGTMAAYTQTLSITGNDVATKTFKFETAKSQSFSDSISIAPGDSAEYKVKVVNVAEADIDFSVSSSFSGGLNGSRVTMTVYDEAGKVLDSNFNKLKVARDGTFTFSIKIDWSYGDSAEDHASDNQYAGKKSNLSVTINGMSTDSNIDHGVGTMTAA
jgi:hypothetical protein